MKNFNRSKEQNNDNLIDLVTKQSKRIEELKQENEKLVLELEKYRLQEKEISETLSYAKKQAESIIGEAKIKYALECERIKVYRQKWTLLAPTNNKTKLIQSFDKTLDTLRECQKEMESMLANDLGEDMESYIGERDRLNTDPCLNYQAIIADTENKIEHLKESELEELLKQL
jgi:hypothetical protein